MRRALLVLLALSLSSCGDEDRARTEETPANDRISTASDDSAPPLARMGPDFPDTIVRRGAPASVSVALAPLGALPLHGVAVVTGKGEASSIDAALAQGSARTSYEGAIRLGNCSRMGPNVASLNPATADSLGAGRAHTDVAIPMDSMVSAPMVVVYGPGGRPAACGALPFVARAP